MFTSVATCSHTQTAYFSLLQCCTTLKDEEDAVVDKLVTDDKDNMEPFFFKLDSEP